MKKRIAWILILTMCLGLFCGCGQTGEQTTIIEPDPDYGSMTIEELRPLIHTVQSGVLRMVTSPDFPPYEFYTLDENGKPMLAGFDIALGQYIADYLCLELDIITMDFDGTIIELGMGVADIGMSGYSPDPERERAMYFSNVYYTGGQAFVCHVNSAQRFSNLDAANDPDLQIGAQLASIQYDLALEFTPDADIVTLGRVTDIVAEVISGKLDGAYIEKVVAENYVREYPELCIVLDVPYDLEGSVVGVNKDNPALLAAVNLAIEAAIADGSMSRFIEEAINLASG